MPTAEQVRHAVECYVFAYERHDKEAFLAVFAPDARLEDPVGTDVHVGVEAIGAFWDQAHSMADRIVLEPREILVCGTKAAMVFQITAMIGDGGMQIDAVDTFEVDDDGKVTSVAAYWEIGKARPLGS